MIHTNKPIIKHKAGLLNLAEKLAGYILRWQSKVLPFLSSKSCRCRGSWMIEEQSMTSELISTIIS